MELQKDLFHSSKLSFNIDIDVLVLVIFIYQHVRSGHLLLKKNYF